MPDFSSLNALFNYLQRQVNSSMEHEVANEVVNVVRDHVQTDVYDAYQPTGTYVRQNQLLNNVKSELIEDGTIEITDVRTDGGKNVTEIVEYGRGYTWSPELDTEIGPRPFLENSIDDLSMNKQHVDTLRKSLINKGLQVE